MTTQTDTLDSMGIYHGDEHTEGEVRYPTPNSIDICEMPRDGFLHANETASKLKGRPAHIEVVNGHVHLVFD